jgi:hypothetical protein
MKEVSSNSNMAAEIAALNRKINQMSVNWVNYPSSLPCLICGGTDHLAINCGVSNESSHEEVNAINQGNFKPNNNPYSNTYNPGWRSHPNFSWRQNDQNAQGNQNYNRPNQGYGNQGYGSNAPPKSNLELMMETFMTSQNQKFDELTKKVDLLATQNKMLENQVAQQATQSSRQLGILPPKPENNPRDVKAVRHMLRSDTQYEDPPMPKEDYVQPQGEKPQGNDKHISTLEDPAYEETTLIAPSGHAEQAESS